MKYNAIERTWKWTHVGISKACGASSLLLVVFYIYRRISSRIISKCRTEPACPQVKQNMHDMHAPFACHAHIDIKYNRDCFLISTMARLGHHQLLELERRCAQHLEVCLVYGNIH